MKTKLTKKELKTVLIVGVLLLLGSIDRFDSYEMPKEKEITNAGVAG
jgi:hypothetical protein